MPDNTQTMRYIYQTEFDPRGVQQAKAGVDMAAAAFSRLSDIFPVLSKQASAHVGSFKSLAQAASDLKVQQGLLVDASESLREQYKRGLISSKGFSEGISSVRALQKELSSMTSAEYERRTAEQQSMRAFSQQAEDARKKLEQLQVPQDALEQSMVRGQADAKKLFQELQQRGWAVYMKEATEYARLFNLQLDEQRMKTEEIAESAKKMKDAMTFGGAFKSAITNLGKAIKKPFEEVGNYFMTLPTRFSEGLKDSISGAFNKPDSHMASAFGSMVSRLFSKKALGRGLLLGPVGYASGVLAGPEKKDQRGFVSGGEGGGMLGSLGKSLSSFGGIIKYAVGALGPAALLFKALAPVMQTLQWAIEPVIAPLQQLLSDVVLQMVPFFGELSGIMVELSRDLLPPFTEVMKSIGPVLIDLTRVLLPPLTKLLKMTAGWIANLAKVLQKVLVPVIGWVADKIVWMVEKIGNGITWLMNWLLDAPVIGWALRKMGFTPAAIGGPEKSAGEKEATTTEAAAQAAPKALPGVNVQGRGVAGETRAMTIAEAGGSTAFQTFTQPRGTAEPLDYATTAGPLSQNVPETAADRLAKALEQRSDLITKESPEEASAPVVDALKKMTFMLLAELPKRIGLETKQVTLANFGAVTA